MLTLDLGNQRAKLRRWLLHSDRVELVDALSLEHSTCLPALDVERWAARRALLSSVANPGIEARWGHWLQPLGLEWERPEPPLRIDVREPESVGRDRLWAAAGALLGRDAALVVDVGTALTVDAARAGTFLGGSIAPGPQLSAEALHKHTSLLPLIEPSPTTRALGQNTAEAIAAGVVLGLRGAAHALVEQAAAEAGFDVCVPVVLTGGARVLLTQPEPFTARTLIVLPDLVHRGLLAGVTQ